MIIATNINKTYQGFDIDHKESGVVLWAKNAFKLTSNQASTVTALRNLSIDVAKGEVFGIYGENGAGKTTLIKILSGLLLPDSGSLQVNGYTKANQIKEQVSYISTNGWMGLEWQLTAFENVMLYGHIFGLPRASLVKRCSDVLDRFGLLEARDKVISELSAGMRQKVTLARGFLLERPILYLDEPSVSLDVPSAMNFRQMLSTYVKPGSGTSEQKTILISSHNPQDLQICDRILLLHKGQAMGVGTLEELKAPLQDIVALHITYAGNGEQDAVNLVCRELQHLAGIHSAISDRSTGNGLYNHVRLLVHQDIGSTGNIVDWFIQHTFPIVSMRQSSVTLQEIYESHLVVDHGN